MQCWGIKPRASCMLGTTPSELRPSSSCLDGHFDAVLLYSTKDRPHFVLLHVIILLTPHHLAKNSSPLNGLGSSDENRLTGNDRICEFTSLFLCFIYCSSTVGLPGGCGFESRKCDSTNYIFSYLECFVFVLMLENFYLCPLKISN